MDGEETDEEVKKRIAALFDFAVSDAGRASRVEVYRAVSVDEASKIEELLSQKPESYHFVLDSHAIRHTIKQHGSERERLHGQIPVVKNDFLLMPDVIAKPDSVECAGETRIGKDAILYKKMIGEEQIFVLKEIRSGRKQLALVTLYKKRRPA